MTRETLALFFECHDYVVSLDAQAVERLVLGDELREVPSSGPLRLVEAGGRGEPYAAFNLGRMLGMGPTSGAGVLMRGVFAGAELRFCLETGPCLLVRARTEKTVPLGPGLFRTRRRAFEAAFPADAALRRREDGRLRAPVGLVLNVEGLITAAERDAAVKAVRAS